MSPETGNLQPLLNAPARLQLAAMLSEVGELDFKSLRDALELSDSVLSRHITTLEKADLVTVRKGYAGKRPRTWVGLTDHGRTAYKAHRKALLAIVKGR